VAWPSAAAPALRPHNMSRGGAARVRAQRGRSEGRFVRSTRPRNEVQHAQLRRQRIECINRQEAKLRQSGLGQALERSARYYLTDARKKGTTSAKSHFRGYRLGAKSGILVPVILARLNFALSSTLGAFEETLRTKLEAHLQWGVSSV
jgi:hypothetical protein